MTLKKAIRTCIKIYMAFDEEKREKLRRYLRIMEFARFICVLGAPYYRGDAFGELVKCKSLKSINKPKFPEKSDISGL
jgi:hypothetical protein